MTVDLALVAVGGMLLGFVCGMSCGMSWPRRRVERVPEPPPAPRVARAPRYDPKPEPREGSADLSMTYMDGHVTGYRLALDRVQHDVVAAVAKAIDGVRI